ncbi:MAG: Ig-like domain-containing protein [Bacteroidales bacterium]
MGIKKIILILLTLVSVYAQFSCANIGRPGGGPKDETPPRFIRSNPPQNSVNSHKRKLDLEFDENILIEKVAEKVIISPPQKEMPEIRSNGRRLHIELKDSLKDSTTYVIDFSDAIVDNNEKNPLKDFSFAFSTGAVIDTFRMSGTVLNAADLEPVTGILVGVQSNLNDSTFTTLPFEKITQTDQFGKFNIKNISQKDYRYYALKDINRTYMFDMPNEDIAFTERIVRPESEPTTVNDTIFNQTGEIDSVMVQNTIKFIPDDLLLLSFNENFKNLYLEKEERKDRRKIELFFTAPMDSLPELKPLNFDDQDWSILEKSLHNDTLTYWIKDSSIYNMDTLRFEAKYLRTDSLKELSMFTDTLQLVFRDRTIQSKKKKKDKEAEEVKVELLQVKPLFGRDFEIKGVASYEFNEPIVKLDPKAFHVTEKVDTIWKDIPFELEGDSVSARKLTVAAKWEPGKEYKINIDSAQIFSLYDKWNDKSEQPFKVKQAEEYSGLFFTIQNLPDSAKAFVELLNDQDKPVRKEPVINNNAEFFNVKPGTYYARLIVDFNGDGVWTTGNYALKRQPEPVYYYSKSINLRPNWDVEQDWNITELPLEQQKPLAITKNKPKEKVPEKDPNAKEEEEDDFYNPGNNFIMPNGGSNSSRPNTMNQGLRR